jgi:hypothetical protein
MRYLVACVFAGVVALAAAAQPGPGPQPQPGPAFDQKLKQEMAALDQREMQLKVEERRNELLRRERELDRQRKNINEKYAAQKKPARRGFLQSLKQSDLPPHLLPFIAMAKLFALGAILCAVLHLLFTIVVFRDMQKRGSVNGLWIPIVLIGGVCGAVVYALMRDK